MMVSTPPVYGHDPLEEVYEAFVRSFLNDMVSMERKAENVCLTLRSNSRWQMRGIEIPIDTSAEQMVETWEKDASGLIGHTHEFPR